MSITYLPKAGSITEKNFADYWNGALGGSGGVWDNAGLFVSEPDFLKYSGLSVYIEDTNYPPMVIRGYVVKASASTDLAVTLPPNSVSYVYLVLDMAGGGTNTVGQRLVYYPNQVYLEYGLLIARVVSGTSSITGDNITYLCNTRPPNVAYYAYEGLTWFPVGAELDLGDHTEHIVQSDQATLVSQFQLELGGVVTFKVQLKREQVGGTATCEVYLASTGNTVQLTLTGTTNSYVEKTGWLSVAPADVVTVYLRNSNAAYNAYSDECHIQANIAVPCAPAFFYE